TAKIIFQSRFGQYFKEALNSSHAFAFLEKPIAKTPVKQQVKDFLAINQPARDDRMEFTSVSCEMEGRSFKKINLTFSLRKIEYFEYMKTIKKVRIVTDNGNFTFSDTMRALEERMKPYGFEMSSRGILVNLDKIVEIKGSSIVLESGAELPLSQKRIVDFRERMGGHIQSSF
ncbi:MAG: LytTR family transcriptional regulator DNA-binding domain-containing protein, partial [Lachnospiraceae bacterium]|nr:LytTR family transcriptional regulator DNA-binding domain-containing protein [Lachnospiraceae bacterium]